LQKQNNFYNKFIFHQQVLHTIVIWLTITLLVWRYLAVCKATVFREWGTDRSIKMSIASAFIGSPLICTPLFLAFSVTWRNDANEDTIYYVGLSELASVNHGLLIKINFWMYSIILKILPSALMTVLTRQLVAALLKIKNQRRSQQNKADMTGMFKNW
jgi:hypothetical protein